MVVLVAFVAFYVPAQFYWALNTSRALDAYFSIQYKLIIQPEGERQISTILDEVQDMPHEVEKLNRIAEWVTTNFTELFWERYLHRNIILQTLDPPINRYRYDPSTGKIRAEHSIFGKNPFTNDPYWISYNKLGACGELAHLFANVSNRAGFETRVVGADLVEKFLIFEFVTNNHAWVEVKIGDEWWYFDPDAYGHYHVLGIESYKDRWFNKTEYYDIFSPDRVKRVYIGGTQEDISDRYPRLVPYRAPIWTW